MDLGLQNKVAIITGGSEGIGRATAWRLSKEGAKVAIVARTKTDLEATAAEISADTGNEVIGVCVDVRDARSRDGGVLRWVRPTGIRTYRKG